MNRLVVVSNRVPMPDGNDQAGGLAVALEPLMARRGGLWFGWSGKVSETRGITRTAQAGSAEFATVDLNEEEHGRYYNGFSNGVLWPLLHSLPELTRYDRRDAAVYREVNERLTAELVPMLRPHDVIWVHDYHLLSMPALLRESGVTVPVGFFLHIPFPGPDMLATLPEAGALIRDLLAADLVGFQTDNDADNFAQAAQRLTGASRVANGLLAFEGRRIRVGVFPAEIEPREFASMADAAWRSVAAERLRRSLSGQKLILGVDRLDPTKGLLQRMHGYRRLLETRSHWRRRISYLQIAPVSRQEVTSYQDLRREFDREAGAINADWGEPDWLPLRIVARAGARSIMGGYMREARVGFVAPLRDGMNLVAKEYVAAQDPQDPGVLVLSRFAGAARQLGAALLVNPRDPDEVADALDQALQMRLGERQDRWHAMWRVIEGTSPLAWGRTFLATLLRASSLAPSSSLRVGTTRPLPEEVLPEPAEPISITERVRSTLETSRPAPGLRTGVRPERLI